MKNVVHVHFIKWFHQSISKKAMIAGATNNIVWRFKKKVEPWCEKIKLVLEAVSVSWMKDAAYEK